MSPVALSTKTTLLSSITCAPKAGLSHTSRTSSWFMFSSISLLVAVFSPSEKFNILLKFKEGKDILSPLSDATGAVLLSERIIKAKTDNSINTATPLIIQTVLLFLFSCIVIFHLLTNAQGQTVSYYKNYTYHH